MKTRHSRAWRVVAAVALLLVAGYALVTAMLPQAGAVGDPRQDLPEPPSFPTETLEPIVREHFAAARARVESAPFNAKANGELGMLYHAYGFVVPAEPCYARALRLDRQNWRWRYFLAMVQAAQGKHEEAAAGLDEVLKQRPGEFAALIRRGELHLERGEYEQALARFKAAVAVKPDSPHAYCGVGRALLQLDEPKGAAEQLARALRFAAGPGEQPRYGTASYALGLALKKLGRDDEARQAMVDADAFRNLEPPLDDPLMQAVDELATGAMETFMRGTDVLRQLERVDPRDPIYERTASQAIELLEQALRIDPELAEAHGELGGVLLKLGDLDGSEASLRKAVELRPSFVEAHYNLGVLLRRRGRAEEAAHHFEQAVALRPGYFEARLGLGTVLTELGRHGDAVIHLEEAVRSQRDDDRAIKRLAEALMNVGRFANAEAVLRGGVARRANDAALADRLAWLLAAAPDDSVRDCDEALRIAEDVCGRTNFAVPQALDTLAAAQACAGRFDEAQRTIIGAIELARDAGREDLVAEFEPRRAMYERDRMFTLPPGSPHSPVE